MRYLTAKDKRRRAKSIRFERHHMIAKTVANSSFVSDKIKEQPKRFFYVSDRNCFYSRVVNRCVISGKAGGVYSYFRLSRMQIREMFGAGCFYGLTKSSW
jgi:small subunit ribosomal protein S14